MLQIQDHVGWSLRLHSRVQIAECKSTRPLSAAQSRNLNELCNAFSAERNLPIALPPLSIYNLSHMDRPSSFLVTLPKAELHLHLEGSIDPTTLVELRRRHGKTSTLAEIEQLYRYDDFNGFLMAFKAVTEDLQTPR